MNETGKHSFYAAKHGIAGVILCLCLSGTVAALAQDLSVKVTPNRNQIYLGESFNLTVEASGSSATKEPDLSALRDCEIQYLGSEDRSRRSVSIINGRVQQESYTGRKFTYKITPEKTGAFRAGPITLTHNSKTYTSPGPTLTVSGIEQQNSVIVTITPSKESVLVDEPFEVTFAICIKRLKNQYSHYDPISPRHPPSISVPYLRSDINGLIGPDINSILQKRLETHPDRAGFSLNDIPLNDRWDFSLFERFKEPQKAKFRLNRKEITKKDQPYYEYSLKLKYTPSEETSHTFGPVIFKGNIITAVDAGGNGTGKPIFAIGAARTVRVIPPPEAGRPASYIGAIGTTLTATSEIDTQTCNLGDPLKMTLSISGDIRLSNITSPDLTEQKDLTDIFKIYDDTLRTETIGNTKKYIYTVRPKQSGTLEIPAIDLSFFDTITKTYKTIQTKPMPLRVNAAMKVAENFIIETSTNRSNGSAAARTSDTLLVAPLDISPVGSMPASVRPTKQQIFLIICGPLLLLMLSLLRMARKALRGNSTARLRENSLKQALTSIQLAQKSSMKNTSKSSHLLYTGIRKYIAYFFSKSEDGLTPEDLKHILNSSCLPQDDADLLSDIFERHFNIAYDSNANQPDNINTEAAQVLALIKKLDTK